MGDYSFAGLCVILIAVNLIPTMYGAGKKYSADEAKELLKPMSKACKSKTGVSEELVKGTLTGNFPRERPLMCYIKCLADKIKVVNKQGQIAVPLIEKQVNLLIKEDLAALIIGIVKACFAKVPVVEDTCEYAFTLMECAYNENSAELGQWMGVPEIIKWIVEATRTAQIAQ